MLPKMIILEIYFRYGVECHQNRSISHIVVVKDNIRFLYLTIKIVVEVIISTTP